MDGDTFEMRMQCRGVVAFSMSTAILKLLLFPFFFQTWNCSSLISGSQKTRHVFFWMFKPFKDFEASDFELLKQRMRLIQRII